MHPTIIEVNTQQFITNLQAIKQQVGGEVKLCLPVKANAYGHGLVGTAKAAEAWVDYLAVSCLDEGVQLRQVGISKPILVFGAFDEEQIPGLIANNLEITISSRYKAELLTKYCELFNRKSKVHIKIDTGMNRVGVRLESAYSLIDYIVKHPMIELVGIFSHFAASEELENDFTAMQINKFKQIVDYVKNIKPSVICHIANSGGVCYHSDSYFDMVRPGLLSYGYFPAQQVNTPPLSKIKPIFSLRSRIAYFKVVEAKLGISYNHRYITTEQTRLITIPIGYGDGYRRGLSNKGQIIVHGKKYPIAGSVCMDMLMLDIGNAEAYVGDVVTLIGQDGGVEITLQELADKLDTIIYEILVGFNERIPRNYI